jgi:starch-binding outer membrane protein, SusD/RagB family
MKPTIVKNVLVIVLLGFFSCSDLEETPYSSITSASFFKNELDAEAAVAGIYQYMSTHAYVYNPGVWVEEMDHFYVTSRNSGNFQLRNMYQFSYTDNTLNQFWRYRYDAINACNVAIKYIPTIDMKEERVNELVAEAKWVRAYTYFNLVRLFGDIPFRVEPTESEDQAFLPRSPVLDIYNEIIIPDLEFAAEHLPLSRFDGRVKRGAAPFLLGKVYLTMARNPINDASKLALAKEHLLDVIDNQEAYGYRLMDRFLDVFPINGVGIERTAFDGSKELNDELIFVIQESRGVPGHGTSIAFSTGPLQSNWTNNATGGQLIMGYHERFYNSFEEGDERRDVAVAYQYIDRRNGNTITWGTNFAQYRNEWFGMAQGKFIDPGQTACCDGNPDIIYYRFSDAYLMLAEAENLINGGPNSVVFDAMDVVLGRAKAPLMDREADWTMESMDDFIYFDRCKEFSTEFHGAYDIRRFNKLEERFNSGMHNFKNATYDPKMQLFPIPSEEKERNNLMTQNPGW